MSGERSVSLRQSPCFRVASVRQPPHLSHSLQEALLLKTRNPCLGLKALHMHCELPTTFTGAKVGDRRMGKLEIALAAQRKLRAMGRRITMVARDIGSLALNVTYT